MKHYISAIITLAVAALLVSCGPKLQEGPEIQKILAKAGNNRGELEKVLKHYYDEPEKLEAARWLILNMPGHYTVDGPEIDSLEMVLQPLLGYKVNFQLDQEVLEKWNRFPFYALTRNDDVRSLKASYLIDNIDRAYDDWKNRPWNKNLSFEEFCELLLPYNIGEARITNWREAYADTYRPKLDSAYTGDDPTVAAKVLYEIIFKEGWAYFDKLISPHRDALMLKEHRVGYNRDKVDLYVYAMRACGIPVAIDQMLISPESKNSHQWVVVKDDVSGRYIPFGFDGMLPDRDIPQRDHRKKGKVYRMTYGKQNDHIDDVYDIRSLPLKIVNPCLKDVSDQYFVSDSATMAIDTHNKEVYLALPVLDEWLPIDVGDVKGDSVTFRNFECGVYYVPAVTYDKNFLPCGYPFYLDSKLNTIILKPDTLHTRKVVLERTMPFRQAQLRYASDCIIGAMIEADDNPDFTSPDTIVMIEDTMKIRRMKFLTPNPKRECKYLRYNAAPGQYVMLAELEVYSDTEGNNKVGYNVKEEVERSGPQYLSDNNLFTAFTVPIADSKFIATLDNPTTIGCLRITARNDGNYPIPGHKYQLVYQDGSKGWRPVGEPQIASEQSTLEFTVPENALLKLIDVSSNQHKQVFTIRNGKVYYSLDLGFFNLKS